ncbi:MAG: outer membrane beta-barrel protein [Gemmatimonadota bacterium]
MNLRRLLFGSTVALAVTLVSALPAQAQLGIGAGLNFSDFEDIDSGSGSATLDGSNGYHFGLFVNLGSGALSLRPGVFYHRLGTYDFPSGDELELSAIEVPIDVRLTLMPEGPVRPFVLAGPVLTFPRSGDFDRAVEDMSLSADIGAGLELNMGELSLMPELRYSVGVTNYFTETIEVGSVTVTPTDGERRIGKLMLRLNVMF